MTQALIVIDVQNDFCPGGALAVPGGDEILRLHLMQPAVTYKMENAYVLNSA